MNNPREKEIINHLNKSSPLSVEQLAVLLAVSEVTVRRDLVELEQKGLIVRKRGGASLPGLGIEPMYNQRMKQNSDLKQTIAAYAADQVSEGDVIALDVGTTVAEFAKELLKKKNLTVFTFSIQVAALLAQSNHNVYLLGGNLRKTEMSMVGSITRDTIMKFHFDRYYLGLAGVSKENGPTDFNLEEVEIKRAIIERSKQVVALVDKTKFGVTSLVKVCEFEEIDEMITNNDSDPSFFEEYPYNGKWVFV
ncbi:DeoR/GlpR family DNA-binding transcription regulator [Cohnella silvisoli]|uniref:DeoR/GlpR family DNA-binding transcription regulator n=1 Tax=Cohnella silvisoli TaxID=2873699 RepID=A0ABV1KNT6_9BACL|nr:DeoR/GlpR family DNA-binding transcription regulator [Cohnella silvisoli]MCD9020961.1 DeoR/GlpR family DNA-binding transcription regulator [Cohnella silvisoli]